MSLVTTTQLKYALGIPVAVTFHDSSLGLAVDYANDRVLRAIGQTSLAALTYSEYPNVYSGGQHDVYLRHTPVVSIVAVTNASSAVAAGDRRVDAETGMLRLINGNANINGIHRFWSTSPDGVAVTYTAGYTSANVPQELKSAALALAEFNFNKGGLRGKGEVKNESDRIRPLDTAMPVEVRAILSRYENTFQQ